MNGTHAPPRALLLRRRRFRDPPERATRTPRPPIVVRRLTAMQMLWFLRGREDRA